MLFCCFIQNRTSGEVEIHWNPWGIEFNHRVEKLRSDVENHLSRFFVKNHCNILAQTLCFETAVIVVSYIDLSFYSLKAKFEDVSDGIAYGFVDENNRH